MYIKLIFKLPWFNIFYVQSLLSFCTLHCRCCHLHFVFRVLINAVIIITDCVFVILCLKARKERKKLRFSPRTMHNAELLLKGGGIEGSVYYRGRITLSANRKSLIKMLDEWWKMQEGREREKQKSGQWEFVSLRYEIWICRWGERQNNGIFCQQMLISSSSFMCFHTIMIVDASHAVLSRVGGLNIKDETSAESLLSSEWRLQQTCAVHVRTS